MSTMPRWLVGVFAGVLAAVLAGGAWFYLAQERQQRQHAEAILQAVANLKARQIADWRAERRGDAAVLMESPFLNRPRHRPGAALNLRIPLSQKDLPAAMAVEGREGSFEGKDYRGVDVLSALKAVPDSPWFLVAKVDAVEALAAWRTRSGLILAVVLGLAVASVATAGLAWQRAGKAHYKALYQAEAAKRAEDALVKSEKHLR